MRCTLAYLLVLGLALCATGETWAAGDGAPGRLVSEAPETIDAMSPPDLGPAEHLLLAELGQTGLEPGWHRASARVLLGTRTLLAERFDVEVPTASDARLLVELGLDAPGLRRWLYECGEREQAAVTVELMVDGRPHRSWPLGEMILATRELRARAARFLVAERRFVMTDDAEAGLGVAGPTAKGIDDFWCPGDLTYCDEDFDYCYDGCDYYSGECNQCIGDYLDCLHGDLRSTYTESAIVSAIPTSFVVCLRKHWYPWSSKYYYAEYDITTRERDCQEVYCDSDGQYHTVCDDWGPYDTHQCWLKGAPCSSDQGEVGCTFTFPDTM